MLMPTGPRARRAASTTVLAAIAILLSAGAVVTRVPPRCRRRHRPSNDSCAWRNTVRASLLVSAVGYAGAMPDVPPPPVELDLRLVPCSTVVAEQRHFGRAAQLLHLTQPSLSRQIPRLEQQLGARLLDRTPRGSRLTAAGEVFLPQAAALLRTAAGAVARTR